MIIDKAIAFLDNLDIAELDRLPPARREKFAALCHHWWQLAERRRERPQPKSGVLSDLRTNGRDDR